MRVQNIIILLMAREPNGSSSPYYETHPSSEPSVMGWYSHNSVGDKVSPAIEHAFHDDMTRNRSTHPDCIVLEPAAQQFPRRPDLAA